MVDCRFYPQLLELLCSLSSLALVLSLSLCPLIPSLPLSQFFSFFSFSHMHTGFHKHVLALTNTLSIFLAASLLPIVSVKSRCFSSPLLLLHMVFIWPCHFWWDRYGVQLISLPGSFSWLNMSVLFILYMRFCVIEGECMNVCLRPRWSVRHVHNLTA